MVEDSNNLEPFETKEISLCANQPKKHVEIVEEIGPLNGLDLKKYFTAYAVEICGDSLNRFYGGVVKFNKKYNPYFDDKESAECKDSVIDRLSWISNFEYTPKEIKEKTKEFLERFQEIKKDLNDAESWTEINNEWLTIKKGLVNDAYNNDEYKEAIEYYKITGRAFVNKSTQGGLKVKRDLS